MLSSKIIIQQCVNAYLLTLVCNRAENTVGFSISGERMLQNVTGSVYIPRHRTIYKPANSSVTDISLAVCGSCEQM